LIVAGFVSLGGCAPQRVVTTESLLGEMTDLAGLAEFPDPPFTCRQFSSYDRKSVSPNLHDDWFANGDAGQFLREETNGGRKEYVMMDADGPGAIVRIWSANPKGTIRIYLDRRETPALEAPMDALLGGKVEGIPAPIAHEVSKGWNCYFPFAYAKHCKVTSDQSGFYYHVNYRTYPKTSRVETFRQATMPTGTIRQAVDRLKGFLPTAVAGGPSTGEQSGRFDVGPLSELDGAPAILWSGSSAITSFSAHVVSPESPELQRKIILIMEFDGHETVRCPLIEFFGTSPSPSGYQSMPMQVSLAKDFCAEWVMPFKRSAKIRLRNESDQRVLVDVDWSYRQWPWTRDTMYFHAKWRGERIVPTRPMRDWNYLTAKGQGVFVGAAFTSANPVKAWWGEGDEKIYVDGEKFPSHFGTGTEDYFGYAWCWPGLFQHAYHNQTRCDGPGNYGWTSVNRWHILDRIPFTRDFRFDMELWHWHKDTNVDMSVVAYWYAKPGATDNFPPIKPEDLVLRSIPPYEPQRVAGAIEGEGLRIIEKTGEAGPQDLEFCSNEKQVWWRGRPGVGDRLVLGFAAPAAGRQRVKIRCVKAVDYGIHQIWVNDEKAGEPIDFYSPNLGVTDEIDLGVHTLAAGENRLRVEVVGANAAALKERMFGLDYVRLEGAE